MKHFYQLFISIVITLNGANYVEAAGALNLPVYSTSYDEQRDPFKDAVAAIKLAKQTNRNVIIEIGGNWCTWCHKMDSFLENNPEIYQQLHSKYVLLKINVSDTNENEEFMKSLPPVLGYPHMYVSTSSGKMLLSKDTAELLENNQYSREHWLAFINKWQVKETGEALNESD
ncbi:MAG: thioredoxin-related protein [Alteromonadaceae bacterium]|jgi:thioredoxin-related protein